MTPAASASSPKPRRFGPTPVRLLIAAATAIFLTEIVVVWAMDLTGIHKASAFAGLFDAAILTVMALPALYFFLYKPSLLHASERARLQQNIAVSEKLSAAGMLASGVAHEINNPLNSILGIAQVLLKEGGLSDRQRRDLLAVEREAKRGGRITRALLSFGRKTSSIKERISIAELFERSLPLIEHGLFKSNIMFEKSIPSPSPDLHADADQLQQVLINLILNAKQAMKASMEKRLSLSVERSNGRVLMHLQDTGCGMTLLDQERIFDPFFTTKPAGMGTGLGLSISYGIVSEHGGEIRISSAVGQGATFTIDLPEYRNSDAAEPARHQEGATP